MAGGSTPPVPSGGASEGGTANPPSRCSRFQFTPSARCARAVDVASISTKISVATRPRMMPVLANCGPSGSVRSKCSHTLATEWTTNQTPALTPGGLRSRDSARILPSCANRPKRKRFDGRMLPTRRTVPTYALGSVTPTGPASERAVDSPASAKFAAKMRRGVRNRPGPVGRVSRFAVSPGASVMRDFPLFLRPGRGSPSAPGLDGEASLDPVLLAALVVGGVLVTHGRQLPDDPRRRVSVEVRAVGDDLGAPIGRERLDLIPPLVADRAGQVLPVERGLAQHLQQEEIVPPVHLLLQRPAVDSLHDRSFLIDFRYRVGLLDGVKEDHG